MSDVYKPAMSLIDIAGEYRDHGLLVNSGSRPRPRHSLLIEFYTDGQSCLRQFGDRYSSNREAISALLDAAKMLNADAAN